MIPTSPLFTGCATALITPFRGGEIDKDTFIRLLQRQIEEDVDALKEALPVGRLDAISEGQMDAASALSGCGPAFVYMFIEALADGGVKCGLPRGKAVDYAAQTVLGSAEMVRTTDAHTSQLKDAVCSPGGSTIAGVCALERGAFRATAVDAVTSAYKRTLELGK